MDRHVAAASLDVRDFVCSVDVDARDLRVVPQPLLHEFNARPAAASSDWDVERFYVGMALHIGARE